MEPISVQHKAKDFTHN